MKIGATAAAGAVGATAVSAALPPDDRAESEPHAGGHGSEPVDRLPPLSEEVRALFGQLSEGSAVSTHWRIEKLHGVHEGAVPVVMSTIYGDRFAVEVFRDSSGGPPPIARAEGLALRLVNGGDGATPTNELRGLGVVALGQALDTRRRDGAPIPEALRTHDERMAHDAMGFFDVPV